MTDEQHAFFDKARRALATARATLDVGDPEAAINRAYYAAHHAASAALLSKGEAPRTHSGTHNRFHFHFVSSGPLPRTMGAVLGDAYNMRQRADYEAFAAFDTLAASDLIVDVERFVDAVEAMLSAS